jgi:hypothetical protein
LGCDSIVTTSLAVNPVALFNKTETICQGDSILLGGFYRKASGTYFDTLNAVNSCDSIVTSQLTVNPAFDQITLMSICQGDSALIGGAYRTLSGNYVDYYQTVTGCDSNITISLLVNPIETSQEVMSVCSGDSLLIAGAYRKQAGFYPETLVALTGCDSIHTVGLYLLPNKINTVAADICQGDSVYLGGSFRSVPGSYVDVLSALNGCDSTLTTVLSVKPSSFGSDQQGICQGDSILLQGSWRTTAGVYYDTLISSVGCDSMLSTTLSVLTTAAGSDAMSMCQGDSISLGGIYRKSPGIYSTVFVAANGCDSILSTTLTVLPTSSLSDNASVCQGDSIFLEGAYQTMAGSYVDTYLALNGCDSTVTTVLSVLPVPSSSASTGICQGDSVYLAGAYQKLAGVYTDVFMAANGCDSLLHTTIVVLPTHSVNVNASICQGDSIYLGGGYQTTAGVYVDYFTSSFSCDSTVTTNLALTTSVSGTDTESICRGDSIYLAGAYQNSTGSYVDTLMASSGCDSVLTTQLTVFQVDTAVSITNKVLTANATGASYRWINCATNSYISGETNAVYAPTANGLYAVEVTQHGCVDTSSGSDITGIGQQERALANMTYRPNPTADFIYIDFGEVYNEVSIAIVNGLGQRLDYFEYENTEQITIDLSSLPSAEYYLQVNADGNQRIIKVVKTE